MPQAGWSKKRERQYEHIKEGLHERGENEDTAEEIAARTVNKERARAGEAKEASRTSTDDISSGRRGGLRSHRGPGGRTRDQLYNEAKRQGHQGPLEDEQGRARACGRSLTVLPCRWPLPPVLASLLLALLLPLRLGVSDRRVGGVSQVARISAGSARARRRSTCR